MNYLIWHNLISEIIKTITMNLVHSNLGSFFAQFRCTLYTDISKWEDSRQICVTFHDIM